ncbi:MAG: endolytic transglycosylase MltG [Tissierellia bacterium]|nr:endolytic transglycosylase MltG [Tissierellia bacterium]
MKKVIDAIRDFIYNITDYGLIIAVVIIMAAILSWRFDILFNRGIEKEIIAELPIITENPNINNSIEENEDTEEMEENEETIEDPLKDTKLIATVNIPQGSFPSQIAEILLNNNLIVSTDEFLTRSIELGLDTRLRSGTFEFEVGTSLDEIIKTLANAL